MVGGARTIVAGGTENMSQNPTTSASFSPNLAIVRERPGYYMSMGLTAEQVAERWDVSREDQDAFALRSHQLAAEAVDGGVFDGQIAPLEVDLSWLDDDGQARERHTTFARDEGPRRDTSPEALARLKPVFKQGGTVTAGNSSQRSDGAAAVVVMDAERAEALGLAPLARFVSFAVAGVAPEVMGIGPIEAVPRALKAAGLTMDDIDLVELNEAFASQSLAVIRKLGMDPDKVNVHGGAIALGHPMGATGAKLTIQLLDELHRRGGRYGLVTMCVGGGMGAAGVFENLRAGA
jgi:acetyl-CoA acyltransferase